MAFAKIVCYLFLGLSWAILVCGNDENITETNNGLNEPDFKTPEYILPCSRKDPKIDLCFVNTLAHIKPYLVKGIPELELAPIDPMVIPELKMENGQGPVRVRASFTNITAVGPGNYSLSKVKINVSNYRIDLHLILPKIEIQGGYDIDGNVLLFPIKSRGDFWALFGDVTAIARIQGVEEIKNGIRYMKVSRLLIDFSLNRARFRIMDHMNGNNVIGQAMNQFLNQNAIEIIDEMKPAASASISKHFKEFLNKIFNRLPLKVWMHDS